MADKPIIFSAPMVRALLDGTKTQTRRVLRLQPDTGARFNGFERDGHALFTKGSFYGKQRLPYAIGDRLWVREAFWTCDECGYRNMCEGGANHSGHIGRWCCASCDELLPRAKTSPIHMPRWASRLTLTVTDVRVQRLQDISLGDICAEGLASSIYDFAPVQRGFDAFETLWNSLHGPGAWAANPWVAAYTFTVHRGNIDKMPGKANG